METIEQQLEMANELEKFFNQFPEEKAGRLRVRWESMTLGEKMCETKWLATYKETFNK